MALVGDHDVIQTLTANRPYDALDVSVLPGRAWRCDNFSDPHRLDPIAEPPSYTKCRDRAGGSADGCPTEPMLTELLLSIPHCAILARFVPTELARILDFL
jgi:hypothetical protein